MSDSGGCVWWSICLTGPNWGSALSLSQIHVTEQAHRGAGTHVLRGAAVLQPRPSTQGPCPLPCLGSAGWKRTVQGEALLLALATARRVSSCPGALRELVHVQLGSWSFRPHCRVSAGLRGASLASVHCALLAGIQSGRPALPWLLRTSCFCDFYSLPCFIAK